ncbi:MAG: response regulator transcription factor [Ardenticatenaceae bacterium]|nr:response regulator transcription factor [Ardenticatenaceae bacterium]MCB9445414.1 response regulator transcription factor [Ardenticatenaceae bacterium]
MKVLIVDDHLLFRQGLVSLLRSEPDIDVCGQAGTVAEAVEAARRLQPDMIIMDFGLPDGKGSDAAQAILAENPNCKILFLTVHADDSELFAAVRSGATGFLLKNAPIEKFLEAIHSVYEGQIALSADMTRRILKEFSRSETGHQTPRDAFLNLSQRELEVLRELANGASNQEIATKLFLSENTVKRHVHSILDKLNLTNRREAAKYARDAGLR